MAQLAAAQSAPTAGLQPGMLAKGGLQPRFTLAGQLVNAGVAPESTTSMIWVPVATLVHASVAVQVRVIVWLVGQLPAVLTSLNVIATMPQSSVAVAAPAKFVPVWPHCT